MKRTLRDFDKTKQQAEDIIESSEKLNQLLHDSLEKARKNRQRILEIWDDLLVMIELVRAYVRGEYVHVPWKVLVYIVAALIYFVNPLDVIPDFIFGFGFLDDAAVIGFVMKAVHDELERFKAFGSH